MNRFTQWTMVQARLCSSGMKRERLTCMMALSGLISRVFLEDMYALMLLSRSACAFMIRSMFALQPYSPVTNTHGLSTMRSETMTCISMPLLPAAKMCLHIYNHLQADNNPQGTADVRLSQSETLLQGEASKSSVEGKQLSSGKGQAIEQRTADPDED